MQTPPCARAPGLGDCIPVDLNQYVKTLSSALQGESAAVLSTIDALATCLERPGGCAVVPGLPSDQYNLTLGTSILGGLVAGYASRLQPDGDRPYNWLFLSGHHACLDYGYHAIQLRLRPRTMHSMCSRILLTLTLTHFAGYTCPEHVLSRMLSLVHCCLGCNPVTNALQAL